MNPPGAFPALPVPLRTPRANHTVACTKREQKGPCMGELMNPHSRAYSEDDPATIHNETAMIPVMYTWSFDASASDRELEPRIQVFAPLMPDKGVDRMPPRDVTR